MSGWDKGDIYHVDLLRNEPLPESNVIFNVKAKEFFENFRINQQFIYREQIASNVALGNFFVTVDLYHVQAFDEDLMGKLMQYPADTVSALENAAKELARKFWKSETTLSVKDPLFDFQVRLTAHLQSSTISMRQLDSTHVGKFVRIPGIVISTSSVVNRPTMLHLQCKFCDYTNQFEVPQYGALGPISIPNTCQGTKN